MQRIVLTYGLIGGAVLSAMLLVTIPFQDAIGFDRGAIIGYTTMVAAFLMVFVGVRTYRDTLSGGTITFGRAFMVGLAITAVTTACYVVTWEVIFYYLSPDFMEKYVAYAAEQKRAAGASEAELAAQAREMAGFMEMYRNPLVNIAITALEPLPVGLVFTFISAGVLSRGKGAGPAVAGRPTAATAP